jgi:hypothetical protein
VEFVVVLTSLPLYFITSRNGDALPAAMGLLRKGRAVFRREDRVDGKFTCRAAVPARPSRR